MNGKKVLIVKNIDREGPGFIEAILKENDIPYDIFDLSKGQIFPDPTDYMSLIVLGGPDSANDSTLKMKNEIRRIREAVNFGLPYLGICLGAQTLVKAMGGEVHKNFIKEIGWRDPEGNYFEMELTDEGKNDQIFKGIKSPMRIFHLHGETVKLGHGMSLLATGKYCKNQVIKVGGSAYGFQGHLELTGSLLDEWILKDPDLKSVNADSLREDFNNIKEEYGRNRKKILTNFLELTLRVRA
ncbi:type 1 glutamine amidotransferase [Candidatus Woesearchaeota archaeon]|nr:type 1 glutamine amidotransferase [Candidatus Woesearchaeota archaeon]